LKYTTASTLTVTESRDRIYAAKHSQVKVKTESYFFIWVKEEKFWRFLVIFGANIFFSLSLQYNTSTPRQRDMLFVSETGKLKSWQTDNVICNLYLSYHLCIFYISMVTVVNIHPPPLKNYTENTWYRNCKKIKSCANVKSLNVEFLIWRYYYIADSFRRLSNHAVWNATRGQV
jgi:hypothetical protein